MSVWKYLSTKEDFDLILQKSYSQYIFLLKHSDTCSISHVAKLRLETQWDLESDELYLVEVKSQRTLSNLIAEKLQIHHESPQLLIIKNGECVHDASHFDITLDEVKEVLAYHG